MQEGDLLLDVGGQLSVRPIGHAIQILATLGLAGLVPHPRGLHSSLPSLGCSLMTGEDSLLNVGKKEYISGWEEEYLTSLKSDSE